MDRYFFASPSRVKFSIVPVNDLKSSQFKEYSDALFKVNEVRLVDVSTSQGLFNPQAYPQGRITYNFTTESDDTESLFLQDFDPFRKVFGTIGIAHWTPDLTDEKLKKIHEELKKEFNNSISHFIMIFDSPAEYQSSTEFVHVVNKNLDNIETSVCDFSVTFLESLSSYASSYQHVTLRSPGTIIGSSSIRPNSTLKEKQKRRISGSLDINQDKIKQHRTKGRRLKISANFFLLAGNLKSAITDFCESIFNLRFANDYLWLASALDGLAVCMLLLTNIEASFQLPPSILTFIESTKDATLSPFMSPSPTASPRPSFQNAAYISNTSNMTTTPNAAVSYPLETIFELINKIMNKTLTFYKMTMGQTEDYVPQIIFSETNLRYIKLLTCINSEGSFNGTVMSHIIYNTPLSITKAFDVDEVCLSQIHDLAGDIFNEEFKNLTVLQKYNIYNSMISVYTQLGLTRKRSLLFGEQINLTVSSDLLDPNQAYISKDIDELLSSFLKAYGIRSEASFQPESTNFVQKKTLMLVLKFCQKIGYSNGVVKYGSILLRHFYRILSNAEQISIFKPVKDLMSESAKSEFPYWDDQIFQGIELQGSYKEQLIQDELADAVISLRNPFAFEVEISELEISTLDGFQLITHINYKKQNLESVQSKISIILKPRSITPISVYLVPKAYGTMKINGIKATVCSCKNQLYTTTDATTIPIMKVKSFSAEDSFKKIENSPENSKLLTANVLYEQPLLSLVDVKLNNRWIMLLEGERKRFEIVLKNSSKVEINQMASKFLDSTIEPLNQLLSSKSLPPNEIYEVEYYLIKKKPFYILNKADMNKIQGNSEFKLEMEIWGKRGVKEACLMLEYSHQRSREKVNFSRNISIPVKVTVYPSIELVGCDIIPLSSTTKISQNNEGDCWNYLNQLTKEGGYEMSDFCLLALDFINSWTEVIEITFQSLFSGSKDPEFQDTNGFIEDAPADTFYSRIILASKKNSRVLIPIKRIDFGYDYLDRRVPSLRNKQFIFDSKTPEAEQRFIKHAFWYRDELLKRMRATWKIPESISNSMYAGRAGTIDLRSIRFSSKMVNALEVEKVGISLSLRHHSNNPVDYENIQIHEFYTVELKLTNRNKKAINGIIRHVPICRSASISIEKKILYNGVLQFSLEDSMEPGDSRVFKLGITFLEKGEYEWGAMFDEMDGYDTGSISIKHQHLEREQLKLKVC